MVQSGNVSMELFGDGVEKNIHDKGHSEGIHLPPGKYIKVHPKWDQFWVFLGRTDAEAETPTLWPPDVKSWLNWKDADAGKDWGQEEKGTTEDEMVAWHHWLDAHEFEQAPGVGNGQAFCGPWGRRVRHDWATELHWNILKKNACPLVTFPSSSQIGWINHGVSGHHWALCVIGTSSTWKGFCIERKTTSVFYKHRLKNGEGNGTPLQYSCLENPMDRGAWWAIVHGVAKSQTRLSDFTSLRMEGLFSLFRDPSLPLTAILEV